MCTKEETMKIVSDSETRIVALVHEEIAKLREEVRKDRDNSHMELSKTISNLGASFLDAIKELKDWRKDIEMDIQGLKVWQTGHNVEAKYIAQKIDGVYAGVRWLLTLVGGAVILAVLNLIIV